MATIPVLVDDASASPSGTLGGPVLSPSPVLKEIDAETIQRGLNQLSEQIASLAQQTKPTDGIRLKQIQVQVGITAEGGIALIGLAKAGVSGAITLTFEV
ncbi:MAG: hypothetical protein ETSY1_00995 [Candidatus Entotheonella factor]|uniref:Pepco domain-containing protein n=1 Tax=Entotheonella factor TaxID=1429438 RepID=W4LZ39_ENTF1|nr:hypothetical protein [Candidatus Entotheonella palauensis]ETX03173.1 MAG: hypothetical protein ETSY1_00995 [Candidatus Entotheonella factor]